jgi:hypothetical protein
MLVRRSAQLPGGGGGGGTGCSPPSVSSSLPSPAAVSLTRFRTRIGLAHVALCIAPPKCKTGEGCTLKNACASKLYRNAPGNATPRQISGQPRARHAGVARVADFWV